MASEDPTNISDRFKISRDRGTLTPEWIDEVDNLFSSPEEKASEIWQQIEPLVASLDRYALLCFCIHYLGGRAIGDFAGDESFVTTARDMGKWLMNLHYFYGDTFLERRKDGIL